MTSEWCKIGGKLSSHIIQENFVKYFVRFLGNGFSRKKSFEIYWPLAKHRVDDITRTKHFQFVCQIVYLVLIHDYFWFPTPNSYQKIQSIISTWLLVWFFEFNEVHFIISVWCKIGGKLSSHIIQVTMKKTALIIIWVWTGEIHHLDLVLSLISLTVEVTSLSLRRN